MMNTLAIPVYNLAIANPLIIVIQHSHRPLLSPARLSGSRAHELMQSRSKWSTDSQHAFIRHDTIAALYRWVLKLADAIMLAVARTIWVAAPQSLRNRLFTHSLFLSHCSARPVSAIHAGTLSTRHCQSRCVRLRLSGRGTTFFSHIRLPSLHVPHSPARRSWRWSGLALLVYLKSLCDGD